VVIQKKEVETILKRKKQREQESLFKKCVQSGYEVRVKKAKKGE